MRADLREAEQVTTAAAASMAEFGGLDLLINNAGGSPMVMAQEASPRFSEAIVRLNLLAPLYCASEAHRIMKDQEGGGNIINIASVSGLRASPGTAAYGAAKAGLMLARIADVYPAMDWSFWAGKGFYNSDGLSGRGRICHAGHQARGRQRVAPVHRRCTNAISFPILWGRALRALCLQLLSSSLGMRPSSPSPCHEPPKRQCHRDAPLK